jgi:DNA-binding beta-propeller fold protein YncE
MAISVHEEYNAVVVYRRNAKGGEAPLRSMRGPNTGLADPHGIYLDDVNNELVVANWGNWNVLTKTFYSGNYLASGSQPSGSGSATGGRYEPPSLNIYSIDAAGDAKPVRTIQGPRTRLNWPSGIDLDPERNEIAVANNGDNSVLIFRRTDNGDAEPLRVIRGSRTGIDRPLAVAIDRKNNELWVANFGDHTAVVFERTAQGNVAPKRIIRNAPAGTPTAGFGNVISVAYDSKRDELLVPN